MIDEQRVLDALAYLECVSSVIVLTASLVISPPWHPLPRLTMPAQYGTLVQSSPVLVVTSILCSLTAAKQLGHAPNAALVLIFSAHYVYRTLVYSSIVSLHASVSVPRCALTFLYAIYSSYLQMRYVTQYATYDPDWLLGPAFTVGSGMWLGGLLVAIYADCAIKRARSDGRRVMCGGVFDYITMPQYAGEMLAWMGFAVACWSVQGLSVALVSVAVLAPRAWRRHRWCVEHVPDFPAGRAVLVPFLW